MHRTARWGADLARHFARLPYGQRPSSSAALLTPRVQMACSCTTLNQAQNPVCGIRCERRRDADASNISACHPSAVHEAGTVRSTGVPGHAPPDAFGKRLALTRLSISESPSASLLDSGSEEARRPAIGRGSRPFEPTLDKRCVQTGGTDTVVTSSAMRHADMRNSIYTLLTQLHALTDCGIRRSRGAHGGIIHSSARGK